MSYHRACVIRRCRVDCEYQERPVPIASITIDSQTGIATATARSPHGRNNGDWAVISGALEDGSPDTTYNGSYAISVDPNYPSRFTYTPWDGTGHPRPTTDATGDMWVGRYSSHGVPISDATCEETVPDEEWTVTVTTATPHFRRPGSNARVVNVRVWDPRLPIPDWTTANSYNGVFELAEVPNAYQFQYKLAVDPTIDPDYLETNCGWAYTGVSFQAYSADGGTGAVIEGNFARQVGKGVFHDTYSSKDLTVRNNIFTDVGMGVQEAMGLVNTAKGGKSLTVPHLGVTATFTVKDEPYGHPHGLAKGDAVLIESAQPPGFNGAWTIKSVPDDRSFTYDLPEYPGQDSATGPFTFQTLWQERHLVIENNVIELKAAIKWWGEPTGLYLVGGEFVSPYVFRQLVVRENIIRHPVGVADPPGIPASRGIIVVSAENAIIENNVIDVEGQYPNYRPIVWRSIGKMRLFNNRTSDGQLLDGYNDVTSQWWRDAAKDIEDSLVLALV
jgi:hypothetical protein